MAQAVESTLASGGVLMAEAGTGTGKTLAYLVPAVELGHKTVISTGTKNLQEQIFFKDVVALEQALMRPIHAVYLKGQENYLCRRRHEEFLRSPRTFSYASKKIAALERWAAHTETGDRMELEQLGDNDPLWREVCSTADTRIGSRCPFYADCFVARARQAAAEAQIVIVNHHLYFADLATRRRGGAILPRHDAVIFDEAHLIEDIATDFFSISVSSAKVLRLLEETQKTLKAARLRRDPGEVRRSDLFMAAASASENLFFSFARAPGRSTLEPAELSDAVVRAHLRLDSALDAVECSLRSLEGRDEGIDHQIECIASLREDLESILSVNQTGFVHWQEVKSRSVVIGASPIDVSTTLREGIFFSVDAVVLTSASLSTGGSFDFLKKRLGIDFDIDELTVPSPFDYERQARLYLGRDTVDPRHPGFPDDVAEQAGALIEMTGGGAFFLSTSIKNMNAVHDRLRHNVPGPLLLQGQAPKTSLIARFVEDDRSVLCATTSFWQGVDIPGDALRLVIIDKLPFASPTDPLVAARIEHLEAAGVNAFRQYQLPSAALVLKQGFGRLIRTETDRGIVAILDSRLSTRGYAKVFFSSLPPVPIARTWDEVSDWWSTTATPLDGLAIPLLQNAPARTS